MSGNSEFRVQNSASGKENGGSSEFVLSYGARRRRVRPATILCLGLVFVPEVAFVVVPAVPGPWPVMMFVAALGFVIAPVVCLILSWRVHRQQQRSGGSRTVSVLLFIAWIVSILHLIAAFFGALLLFHAIQRVD